MIREQWIENGNRPDTSLKGRIRILSCAKTVNVPVNRIIERTVDYENHVRFGEFLKATAKSTFFISVRLGIKNMEFSSPWI